MTPAPASYPITHRIPTINPIVPNTSVAVKSNAPIAAPTKYVKSVDNTDQSLRLKYILFKPEPYKLFPQNSALPPIVFTLSDLLNFVNGNLRMRDLYQEDPWLVGGAASHVMTGIEYGDVDICFYLKKNKSTDVAKQIRYILHKFIERKLKFYGYYIDHAQIDLVYLSRKTRKDGFVWYNLGEIDLKFHLTDDHRRSISSTDGFHISLSLYPKVCCVDGYLWCNQEAFEQAVVNLSCRKLILKDARIIHDLAWRLTHRITQGFSIHSTENLSFQDLSVLAFDQLVRTYPLNDPKAIQALRFKFSTHQSNHYGPNELGRMVDFFNLLNLLLAADYTRDLPRSQALSEYIKIFIQEWKENSKNFHLSYNCDSLFILMENHPEHAKELLAIVRGIFLTAWISSPHLVSAYTFNFAENPQTPRLHIGLPENARLKYYVKIDNTPMEEAKQFLNAWKNLEKQCSGDIHFLTLGAHLIAPFPDLTTGCRLGIIKFFSRHFVKPPIINVLTHQYRNTQVAALESFYKYLQAELAVPCPSDDIMKPLLESEYFKSSQHAKLKEKASKIPQQTATTQVKSISIQKDPPVPPSTSVAVTPPQNTRSNEELVKKREEEPEILKLLESHKNSKDVSENLISEINQALLKFKATNNDFHKLITYLLLVFINKAIRDPGLTTHRYLSIQNLLVNATKMNLVDAATASKLVQTLLDVTPKDMLTNISSFLEKSLQYIKELDLLSTSDVIAPLIQKLYQQVFENKQFPLERAHYIELIQLSKHLFIEATNSHITKEGRQFNLNRALFIVYFLDLSNPTIQPMIVKCWLEGIGKLLLSDIPQTELQDHFATSLETFMRFNGVAQKWPEECQELIKLAKADFLNLKSQLLFRFFSTMATIDSDLHLQFLDEPELKEKMNSDDFTALQSFLENQELANYLDECVQIYLKFINIEKTVFDKAILKTLLGPIIQKNPNVKWFFQTLQSYIQGSDKTDGLINIRNILQEMCENEESNILFNEQVQNFVHLILLKILENALNSSTQVESIIAIEESIIFSNRLGLFNTKQIEEAAILVLKHCIEGKNHSAELLVATDHFIKKIGINVPDLLTTFQRKALQAAQTILNESINERTFELSSQCLYIAMKPPCNTQKEIIRICIKKLLTYAMASKQGVELRTVCEVMLLAMKNSILFDDTESENIYALVVLLLDMPSASLELFQSKRLYRDIGLTLLVELSNRNVKISNKFQILLMQKMFETLIAVGKYEKIVKPYKAYVTAYSRLTETQQHSTLLPSLVSIETATSFVNSFKQFIKGILHINNSQGMIFANHPNLIQKLSPQDYLEVQIEVFNLCKDNTQKGLIEKFGVWQKIYSTAQRNNLSLVTLIAPSIGFLNEMGKQFPVELKNQILAISEGICQILEKKQIAGTTWGSISLSKEFAEAITLLHRFKAPRIADRLSSTALKCGLIFQSDVKQTVLTVIDSQTITPHFINKFNENFSNVLIVSKEEQLKHLSESCELIRNSLLTKDKTLHKAVKITFQNLLTLPRYLFSEESVEPYINNLVTTVLKEDSEDFDDLIVELLFRLRGTSATKLTSDFTDELETESFTKSFSSNAFQDLLREVAESGKIWRSDKFCMNFSKILSDPSVHYELALFIMKNASIHSDEKLFAWIQREILSKGIRSYFQRMSEHSIEAFLGLFEHVYKICENLSSDRVLPYATILLQQWKEYQQIPWQPESKVIHEILIKVVLKASDQTLILKTVDTFSNPTPSENLNKIWDLLRAIQVGPAKKGKRPVPEKTPLKLIAHLQTSKEYWHNCNAASALSIYFFTLPPGTGTQDEVLEKELAPLFFNAVNSLLFDEDPTKVHKLLNAASKYYGETRLTLRKAEIYKAILQAEIAGLKKDKLQYQWSYYFETFQDFMREKFFEIHPNGMREYLILLFTKVPKSDRDLQERMVQLLNLADQNNLFPIEDIKKKKRDNGLDQIALQRIKAENFIVQAICEDGNIEFIRPDIIDSLFRELYGLIGFVDLKIQSEVEILLEGFSHVFDKVFFELLQKPDNRANYDRFMQLISPILDETHTESITRNILEFAARILRRICFYKIALSEIDKNLSKKTKEPLTGVNPITSIFRIQVAEGNFGNEMQISSKFIDTLGLKEPSIKRLVKLIAQLPSDEAYRAIFKGNISMKIFGNFLISIVSSKCIQYELNQFAQLTKSGSATGPLKKHCKVLITFLDVEATATKLYPDIAPMQFNVIKQEIGKICPAFISAYVQLKKLGTTHDK